MAVLHYLITELYEYLPKSQYDGDYLSHFPKKKSDISNEYVVDPLRIYVECAQIAMPCYAAQREPCLEPDELKKTIGASHAISDA